MLSEGLRGGPEEFWLSATGVSMAMDVTEFAVGKFRSWAELAFQFERMTVRTAFHAWLREGGMEVVGEQYGIAVETLLTVLGNPNAFGVDFLPPTTEDGLSWSYMTEVGFRLEIYLCGDRSRLQRRVGATGSGDLSINAPMGL